MNNHIPAQPARVEGIDVRTPRPTCRRCGSRSPLTIDVIAGPDDDRLTMTSCPECEHREWTYDAGGVAGLDVLCLLSGKPDFSLAPSAGGARRRSRARGSGS